MKNSKLAVFALLHTLGIAVYVAGVSLFFRYGENIFGQAKNFIVPIAFLLLFVLSAAVTGTLALGRPAVLFFDGRRAEAVKMFLYTIGWLLVIFLALLASQILR